MGPPRAGLFIFEWRGDDGPNLGVLGSTTSQRDVGRCGFTRVARERYRGSATATAPTGRAVQKARAILVPHLFLLFDVSSWDSSIQRTLHRIRALAHHVRVDLRRPHIAMPEQFLHGRMS